MTTEFQPIVVLDVYTTFAWVQPVGGGSDSLSLVIADGRYLKKTVPDTATAIETFSAGIVTDTINPQNLSALDIANTTYTLFGGASAINIGKNMTSGSINVLSSGSATFNVNGAGLLTNNINATDPSASMNIGVGYTSEANNINIGTNKTAGNIEVLSASGSATFNVYGAGLLTNNINATDPSAPMNIGVGYTSEGNNIEIGTNKIAGKINMLPALSGTAVLQVNGAGIRTGDISSITDIDDINIGGEQTSGWTYIADGVLRTGRTYIANRTAAPVYIASEAAAGSSVTIGSSDITTTVYGNVIKQITPLLGGGTCEVSYGNSTNVTSLSTIFNRKNIQNTSPINLYQLVIPTNGIYSSQYFEIIIAGSNQNFGAYSYKGSFAINNVTATSVNTIFSTGGIPTFTFSNVGTTITMTVSAVFGASTNQCFISTLIAYPTININDELSDYSVISV